MYIYICFVWYTGCVHLAKEDPIKPVKLLTHLQELSNEARRLKIRNLTTNNDKRTTKPVTNKLAKLLEIDFDSFAELTHTHTHTWTKLLPSESSQSYLLENI